MNPILTSLPASALSLIAPQAEKKENDDWFEETTSKVNESNEAKSRFFSNDSDSESQEGSPEQSAMKTTPETPATLVCQVISKCHQADLTPKSQSILKTNLEKLNQKNDTPHSPEKGIAAKKIGTALNGILYGSDNIKQFSSPVIQSAHDQLRHNKDLQKLLFEARKFENQVQNKLSPTLSLMNISYPNLQHIVNGDHAGGMHYSLHTDKSLSEVQFSTLTPKVFCAKTKKKFSSFFNAAQIKPDELKNLLMDPKRYVCAREGDRVLFLSQNNPFLIESYERCGFVTSAYPIFFHAHFRTKTKYQITKDLMIESHDVLNTAIPLIINHGIKDGGPIKYYIPATVENCSCFVIDIAPALKISIKSGVYFFIPTDVLVIAENIEPILNNFILPK